MYSDQRCRCLCNCNLNDSITNNYEDYENHNVGKIKIVVLKNYLNVSKLYCCPEGGPRTFLSDPLFPETGGYDADSAVDLDSVADDVCEEGEEEESGEQSGEEEVMANRFIEHIEVST